MSQSSAARETAVRAERPDAARRERDVNAPKTALGRARTKPGTAANADTGRKDPGGRVEEHLWLRRGDQLIVGLLAMAALALMAGHWAYLSGWGMQPIEIEHLPARKFDYRLNINSASRFEWMQLEGIGDTLAERIVRDREQNGPFESVEDLQRVKGIGPKTVERLRRWLRVETDQPPTADRL